MTTFLSVALALIGAWLVPFVAMRVIMKFRFKSGKQQTVNYAGKTISYGLALVWVVWAASLAIFLLVSALLTETLPSGFFTDALAAYSLSNTFFVAAVPLVVLCFFFGWLDDRFGKRGDGGFKGHIKSLLRGKLTTGMVKVLGIGFASLAVSIFLLGTNILFVILATCAIALSANLINLFDLRPTRASKAYLFSLTQVALISICTILVIALVTNLWNPWQIITQELIHLIWMTGPVCAIWSFDAGEQAMLGDAGANPAGALLGLFAVSGLFILLPIYVLAVLTLNLISEKVSFTAVIEHTPILKKVDMWGRPSS